MELFLCHRRCLPPSAVTVSCSAFLDGHHLGNKPSLIVGRGSQLEIYHSPASSRPSSSSAPTTSSATAQLKLRAVFPLAGTLVGIQAVTVAGQRSHRRRRTPELATVQADDDDERTAAAVDVLLLSFSSAKVPLSLSKCLYVGMVTEHELQLKVTLTYHRCLVCACA